MKGLIVLVAILLSACEKSSPAGPTPPNNPPPAPANRNPVIATATISPIFGIDGLTLFSFAANASDPDGDPITYTWRFSDGTVFHEGQSKTTRLRGNTLDGVLNLTVTDSRGGSATTATDHFVLASMSNDWVLTSPSFPGVAMSSFTLQQDTLGAITGAVSNGGRPIEAPSRIESSGRVEIRFKLTNDVDVTVVGQMQQSGREVVGTFAQSNATFNGLAIKGLTAILSVI